MPRYSFTQPICGDCFEEREPGRMPSKLLFPEEETCCFCGDRTVEGIYYRVDPSTVDHPTMLKEA